MLNVKDTYKPSETKIEILDTQTSFLILDIHTAQNGRYEDRKEKETSISLREIQNLLNQQRERTH
jgi:hypothetical protein